MSGASRCDDAPPSEKLDMVIAVASPATPRTCTPRLRHSGFGRCIKLPPWVLAGGVGTPERCAAAGVPAALPVPPPWSSLTTSRRRSKHRDDEPVLADRSQDEIGRVL